MSPYTLIAMGAAAVICSMTLLWLVGLRHRNFSYVDLGWSANFALLAILCGAWGRGWPLRKWLLAAMFTIWSLRLALHLARRIIGEPEEGRYVELRSRWAVGGHLNLKFWLFFQFQALLNLVLAMPLFIAADNAQPGLSSLEIVAAAIWGIGVVGESIADRQLASFKRVRANKGQVCDVGLWRYSRHPNYFFEWTIWIGYAVFALASPYGWFALALPALMLHFLINVTGVKPTEAQAVRSKGENYRRYQRETSMFIPLPRKRHRIVELDPR